jgi:hypothetical protein
MHSSGSPGFCFNEIILLSDAFIYFIRRCRSIYVETRQA